MDRDLNIEHLTRALGELDALPSATELRDLIVELELNLFTGHKAEVSPRLIETAWYLHALISRREASAIYGVERVRRACQVSGHVLDLLFSHSLVHPTPALEHSTVYAFAAQIAYWNGDRQPNARSIQRKVELPDLDITTTDAGELALHIGILWMGFDKVRLFNTVTRLSGDVAEIRRLTQPISISVTKFGSVATFIEAVEHAVDYAVSGNEEVLQVSIALLRKVARGEFITNNIIERWVATHLYRILQSMGGGSVWAVLPKGTPPSVAKAMVLGYPSVLNMWPPQLNLLKGDQNPLSPTVERSVISFPTSGGKTLVVQMAILSHLASGNGGVCVVAPLRTLCREIMNDLRERIRYLDVDVSGETLDVLTPEQLLAQIRSDSMGTMEKYNLFIFDEVHFVSEPGRGFIIEQLILMIHLFSSVIDVRLVVLSAGIGNRAHIASWIHGSEEATVSHSDWRGPRRLNAVFKTQVDWSKETKEPARGNRLARVSYPQEAILTLRFADDTGPKRLRFTKPVGALTFKVKNGQRESKRDTASTAMYVCLAQAVSVLVRSGPVLVIESTRNSASKFAQSLASFCPDVVDSGINNICENVSRVLGEGHPLVGSLRSGVAFHHAGLPRNVQEEIEGGLRSGTVKAVVATTTLIEGVNLPVKTVVISRTRIQGSDSDDDLLTGSRLLNAIGRAGRAGKENEGWVIIADPGGQKISSLFEKLNIGDDELQVVSNLAMQASIESAHMALGEITDREDRILGGLGETVDGFVTSVWLLLSVVSSFGVEEIDMEALLKKSLWWRQMDERSRQGWMAIASSAKKLFYRTEQTTRQRWVSSPYSLSVSSQLEGVAKKIRDDLAGQQLPEGYSEAKLALLSDGRLREFCCLGGGQYPQVRPYVSAPSSRRADLDLWSLLDDWIGGLSPAELVERYFASVTKKDYAFEQLADIIGNLLQHRIPSAVGVVCRWLHDWGNAASESHSIVEYVRWGVSSMTAANLMRWGLGDRSVATAIAAVFERKDDEVSLRDWVSSMTVTDIAHTYLGSETHAWRLAESVGRGENRMMSRLYAGKPYHVSLDLDLEEGPCAITMNMAKERTAHMIYEGQRYELNLGVQTRLVSLLRTGLPIESKVVRGSETTLALEIALKKTRIFKSISNRSSPT